MTVKELSEKLAEVAKAIPDEIATVGIGESPWFFAVKSFAYGSPGFILVCDERTVCPPGPSPLPAYRKTTLRLRGFAGNGAPLFDEDRGNIPGST